MLLEYVVPKYLSHEWAKDADAHRDILGQVNGYYPRIACLFQNRVQASNREIKAPRRQADKTYVGKMSKTLPCTESVRKRLQSQ